MEKFIVTNKLYQEYTKQRKFYCLYDIDIENIIEMLKPHRNSTVVMYPSMEQKINKLTKLIQIQVASYHCIETR